tara:strand:+ start:76 stop:321 length:246 start_codon:yes stop_codon:yes gene_type:complete
MMAKNHQIDLYTHEESTKQNIPLHVKEYFFSKQDQFRSEDSVSFQIKLSCEVERIYIEYDVDKNGFLEYDEVIELLNLMSL